ncbi:collagen alpha-1(I) chain-like isoform X3 [Globicephala melas]|uniref:collagen alpha-1(I) chain-like isoform X3 n=1 Tax=Globicephala melas TaxID=9731 RepID=UPI00293D6843|nr:sterile alpha motif domain-containing protein 1-like isoform X3 [Globicephala melas]
MLEQTVIPAGAPLQPAATLSFAQRPRPGSQLTAQLSTSPGPPGPLLAPHHLTVTGFPRRLGGESGSGTSHMEKPETLLALERAEITAKHKCGPVGATAAGTVMFQAGIPAKAEKAEPSQGSCVASAPRASASAAAAPTQRGPSPSGASSRRLSLSHLLGIPCTCLTAGFSPGDAPAGLQRNPPTGARSEPETAGPAVLPGPKADRPGWEPRLPKPHHVPGALRHQVQH